MTAFTAAADRISSPAFSTSARCSTRPAHELHDAGPIAAAVIDQRLQALDWGPIAFQLTDHSAGLGWSCDRAANALAGYLQFLRAIALFPQAPLVPSPDIDQAWHCHLLDTQKYAADCQFLFGRFIDHNPYAGVGTPSAERALRAAWQQTCDALVRTASQISPLAAVWADGPTTCILSNGEITNRPRRVVCVSANLAVQL
ncbi:MAG: hypothetical protein EA001_10265 [Oscillatoriales cyanobacterium]|nr:MAG: hypothetical protein EA001_10265 [Oscillatoriales cyanobacterium]